MHLIYSGGASRLKSLYPGEVRLSRAYTLPYIFRKLRIHRNLTLESLSQKVGFPANFIRSFESGQTFPSLKFCLACGDLFGFNPNWIKGKWAYAAVTRYRERLLKRLWVADHGGGS